MPNSPKYVVAARERFADGFRPEALNTFVGRDPVVLYSGDEGLEPHFGDYVGFALIYTGKRSRYTLDPTDEKLGVRESDVRGRKVLVVGGKRTVRSVADRITTRFGELSEKGVIDLDDIRVVTADPFGIYGIDELERVMETYEEEEEAVSA